MQIHVALALHKKLSGNNISDEYTHMQHNITNLSFSVHYLCFFCSTILSMFLLQHNITYVPFSTYDSQQFLSVAVTADIGIPELSPECAFNPNCIYIFLLYETWAANESRFLPLLISAFYWEYLLHT